MDFLEPLPMRHVERNKKNGDSLAMYISALAISGAVHRQREQNSTGICSLRDSEVDGSVGLKAVEETIDSLPEG